MIPSPPETRASLILRLRDAADVSAWDEVVAIYSPLVYRMAIRQGLQPTDAEDVVQEVFSAVAKSVSNWADQKQRGKFRNWLIGITRNIAINVLTRRPHGGIGIGGEFSPEVFAEIPIRTGELSSQFDLEYQREVYRWAAEQVRNSVSPGTWEAFEKTHVQGEAIDAVARELEMSVGSIYIARSRVMKRLKELAEQFEVNNE